MSRPGPRNTITDVPGITVGNAENFDLVTGTTVVLADKPAVAAADVRGGAPGVRDTEALAPTAMVQQAHAICLSGGSAFGLDAAGGVMDWLRRKGRGIEIGTARVPIVPAAIIFDLLTGPDPSWEAPPWWDLGLRAAETASRDFSLGNAGAGLGAIAGQIKGGLGTASAVHGELIVGALAVSNPVGSVTMPGSNHFWAWALEQENEFGGLGAPNNVGDLGEMALKGSEANTTLVVVATNATLDWAQSGRLAIMAQDGFARAIRPVHCPMDGDTVFVLATGEVALPDTAATIARLGMMAADCAARAITRGVYEARALAGIKAWRDLER
ncbi:MAG: P1 family peptidase [Pseudomonadota bacterium]